MEVAEFKRILDIGLGRAILFLESHDATPYREVILNACLHNTAYDRQVEGTRAEYMLDIVRLTGELEYYREQVFSALSAGESDDYDTQHQLVFASLLAGEGDERARQVVYERVERNLHDHLLPLVLINMDGLQGFTFIVERLTETQPDLSDAEYQVDFLISMLEDRDGRKHTQRKLKQYSVQNPKVAPLIQAAFAHRERRKQVIRKRLNPKSFRYDDIKIWMNSPETLKAPPVTWVAWGKYASEEDLNRAALDLLQVADRDTRRIFAYMQIFKVRQFPLEPDRLIDWAKQIGEKPLHHTDGSLDPEARIPYFAMSSLSLFTHPKIRALALWMIEHSKEAGRAVTLLAANYQNGDWQLIASLTKRNFDVENIHSLGFSVEDVFKQHPSDEAIPTLIYLYEYDSCSHCRRRFVESLASLNAVPYWMQEECKHDANIDLRQLAHNDFKYPEK